MKQAREQVLDKNNLDIKLNSIFSQIIYKNISKEPYFYNKDKSLFFHFDNGIDPDPKFSSEVAAQLFIDKNNDLILKISPLGKNNKIYREEILMKNMKALSFEFTKKLTQKKPQQTTLYTTVTSWDKDQDNIPAIIKIYFTGKEDDHLSFAFFLPTRQSSITYFDKAK